MKTSGLLKESKKLYSYNDMLGNVGLYRCTHVSYGDKVFIVQDSSRCVFIWHGSKLANAKGWENYQFEEFHGKLTINFEN